MLGRMPGQWELIILAVILVLLFGAKRVPQIARSLGQGVRELKDTVGAADPRADIRRTLEAEPPAAPEDEARNQS